MEEGVGWGEVEQGDSRREVGCGGGAFLHSKLRNQLIIVTAPMPIAYFDL